MHIRMLQNKQANCKKAGNKGGTKVTKENVRYQSSMKAASKQIAKILVTKTTNKQANKLHKCLQPRKQKASEQVGRE